MPRAAPDTPMRILLGDGHALFQEAFRARLAADRRFELLPAASDAGEAVRLAKELHPDVVLLDAALPGDGAVEATRCIRKDDVSVRVLILTGDEVPIDSFEAQEAGAAGFLRKDRSAARLLATIPEVSQVVAALGDLSSS